MKNLAFIQDSLIDSLLFAKEVAEKLKVKVATLPDLIKLRTNLEEESQAWSRWITPLSTIYFGIHNGKRLVVVAHHLGPLSTKERLLEWNQSGLKDEGSTRYSYQQKGMPKVTPKEFSDLIEGKYGEVKTIDFDYYMLNWKDHFNDRPIVRGDALNDPLIDALFGEGKDKFVEKHFQISQEYANSKKKEEGAGYKILTMRLVGRYGWSLFSQDGSSFPSEEYPIGFFLTLGCPSYYANSHLSVSTEIGSHHDLGHTRFVVLNDLSEDIHDVRFDVSRHWESCLVDSKELVPELCTLLKKGEKFFVEYPKDGNRMDTGESMLEVLHHEVLGDVKFFETPTYGSPFLKYHLDEVKAIAPKNANAYQICGNISPAEIARVPVQFYKVNVNSQKRILRPNEVMANLPLLLKINGVEI